MMLNVFVLVIVALIVSMTWSEGLWGNLLSMLNAFFAAIIATNVFEPAANFMDGQAPSLTYFWDFLMLWLIFGFTYGILRAITDQISPTRVRFKLPVEAGGTGPVRAADRLGRRLLLHFLVAHRALGSQPFWQGLRQSPRRQ